MPIVNLYAGMRDRAGSDTITIDLSAADADAATILSAVADQHPNLAPYCRVSRVAVDDHFIRSAVAITNASKIDIIPPVSGG
ncbi:MAG: MoaD/ThiS family protein [Planctomycetota bacterium]|jgi:molybdopterin converting factor small subunit